MKKWKGLKRIIASLMAVSVLVTGIQFSKFEVSGAVTQTDIGKYHSPNRYIEVNDFIIIETQGGGSLYDDLSKKYIGFSTTPVKNHAEKAVTFEVYVDNSRIYNQIVYFTQDTTLDFWLNNIYTKQYSFQSVEWNNGKSTNSYVQVNTNDVGTMKFYLSSKSSVSGANNKADIITTDYLYGKNREVTVGKYDISKLLGNKSEINVSDINFESVKSFDGKEDYVFSCIKAGSDYVTKLRKNGNKYQYTVDNQNWKNASKDAVKIYYMKTSKKVNLVNTIDTRDVIRLNVFNYATNELSAKPINVGKKLYFYSEGANSSNDRVNINCYSNSKGITQVVNNKLDANKYPVVAAGNQSLEYLFTTDVNASKASTIVANASYLFSFDEQTGYYSYDSTQNTAYLDVNTSNFWVSSAGNEFYPFTSANTDVTDKYSFGMNVDFSFIQPKDGLVNAKPMKFEFSGDDDVWIFIDDALTLDLGGIHQNASGYIDFAAGTIVYNDSENTKFNTTLYAAFQAAGYTETQLENLFTADHKTFKNYTAHQLRMFYLERGAGNSNCKLYFNLPVIARDSLAVSKEVDSAVGASYDTSKDYEFRLYLGKTEATMAAVKNISFDIYKNGVDTGKDGVVSNSGIFTLKDGETAVFANIEDESKYYVEEVNPGEKFKVLEGSKELTSKNGSYASETKAFEVGKTNSVTITNLYLGSKEDLLKVATFVDEKNRVYKLDLSATIKGSEFKSEVTIKNQPLDMVLILDASTSMKYPGDLELLGTMTPSQVYQNYYSDYRAGRIFAYSEDGYPYQLKHDSWYDYYYLDDTLTNETVDLNEYSSRKFYRSPSYGTNKAVQRTDVVLQAMENAITELKKHEGSTLTVLCFNSQNYTLLANKAVSEINDTVINNLKSSYVSKLNSYTQPSKSLMAAESGLKNLKNNLKYVVVISDGCPTASNITTEINNCKSYSKKIMEAGAKVISIGIDLDTIYSSAISGSRMKVGEFFASISSKDANDEAMTYSVESNKLVELFGSLVEKMTNETVVTNVMTAEVRDYIDPRFDVVVKSGDSYKLVNVGEKVTSENGVEGVLKKDNDTYYISWDAAYLDGWKGSVLVRAKENFMGGNAAYTNTAETGIYVDNKLEYRFENPLVNVPTLDIEGSTTDKTVFIEDSITPLAYLQESKDSMFKNAPSLTADEIKTLFGTGKIDPKKYYYYGNEDKDCFGEFVYSIEKNGENTSVEHKAIEKGYHVEEYVIHVKYVPMSEEDRLEILDRTNSSVVGTLAQAKEADASIYVNVVEGQINIVKLLESNTSYDRVKEGDPIFTFKIERYEDSSYKKLLGTFYRTVRFDKDSVSKVEAEALKNLPRGYYRISELNTQRYTMINIKNSVITFTNNDIANLGKLNGKTNLTINKGAEIDNKKTGETGKQTDTDVVMNRYEKDPSGKWIVVAITTPQQPDGDSKKSSEEQNKDFEAVLPKKNEENEEE